MEVAASSTASSPSSVPSQAAWCAIFQCWSGKSWKLWKREKKCSLWIEKYWKKAFNTLLTCPFCVTFCQIFISGIIFLGPKLCTIYLICLHYGHLCYAPFGRNKPTGSIEPLSSIGGTFATISRSYLLGQGCPHDWGGGARPWHRLQTLTCNFPEHFLSFELLLNRGQNFGDNGLEN